MNPIDQDRLELLEARVLADGFLVRHLLAEAAPTVLDNIAAAATVFHPTDFRQPLSEKQLAIVRRMVKSAIDGARNRQEHRPQS